MRGKKTMEVRKVIEPELLDREDQIQMVRGFKRLRSTEDFIRGHLRNLSGALACSNHELTRRTLAQALTAIKFEAEAALEEVGRLPIAS